MSLTANRLKRIKPSPTLAATRKAMELQAAGKDVISLSAGEPDFTTPDFVKDAACEAIKKRRAIIFSNRKIALCYKYLRALLTDPKLLAKIIATSLISQVMYFAAVYAVIVSLDAEFSFIKFMAIVPIITLISSLPVGYGGWGIREGAFIYGLGLINIPLEAAFMASVQIGLLSMLLAISTGIPALIDSETQLALKNWKLRKTRVPAKALKTANARF